MSKSWHAYAHHILDVAARIERIQARGDLTQDVIKQYLPHLVANVQSMLATDQASNF